jgi:hypothetical protein
LRLGNIDIETCGQRLEGLIEVTIDAAPLFFGKDQHLLALEPGEIVAEVARAVGFALGIAFARGLRHWSDDCTRHGTRALWCNLRLDARSQRV